MVEVEAKSFLVKKTDKGDHRYECPPDCNLGEIFDVICEYRVWVIEKMKEASAQQDKQVNDARAAQKAQAEEQKGN